MDKNFDPLVERFARRVYGGLKGDIRLAVLWRDLQHCLQQPQYAGRRLRILDVGGGLGQLTIRLAKLGHSIVFNELSAKMIEHAKSAALQAGIAGRIEWRHCGWQALPADDEPYDLLLCHAVLEWVDQPKLLITMLCKNLAENGTLSLCFYNPVAKHYRNLIRGNFNLIDAAQPYQSDVGSLTPNNPQTIDAVRSWLVENGCAIQAESGIRVFHDYVVEKRGGHSNPAAVIDMELRYSNQQPYKMLGRYFHIIAGI